MKISNSRLLAVITVIAAGCAGAEVVAVASSESDQVSQPAFTLHRVALVAACKDSFDIVVYDSTAFPGGVEFWLNALPGDTAFEGVLHSDEYGNRTAHGTFDAAATDGANFSVSSHDPTSTENDVVVYNLKVYGANRIKTQWYYVGSRSSSSIAVDLTRGTIGTVTVTNPATTTCSG